MIFFKTFTILAEIDFECGVAVGYCCFTTAIDEYY